MQRDLRAALDAFVASHRGLRVGRLFGSPAAFAGRRVFARLDNDGLRLRLPPAARVPPRAESERSFPPKAGPSARHRRAVSSYWTTIAPHSDAAQRLEILLEQSARYVALA